MRPDRESRTGNAIPVGVRLARTDVKNPDRTRSGPGGHLGCRMQESRPAPADDSGARTGNATGCVPAAGGRRPTGAEWDRSSRRCRSTVGTSGPPVRIRRWDQDWVGPAARRRSPVPRRGARLDDRRHDRAGVGGRTLDAGDSGAVARSSGAPSGCRPSRRLRAGEPANEGRNQYRRMGRSDRISAAKCPAGPAAR